MTTNRRLNTTITIGGAVTAGFRSAVGSTVESLRRIGYAIRDTQRQQRDVGATIEANRRAGRSVAELQAQYDRLGSSITRMQSAQSGLAQNAAATQANQAQRGELRSKIGDALVLGAASISPIVQAAKFEKAMLGVAKQVEGARDKAGNLTAEYYAMAKQVQELARVTPLATNDIAEMVAAGARMGVAKNELIGFTKTAAMMASAFDLPAGQLADDMGKIAGMYKIPIPAIGELADTINYLDDNAISKGADIIDFLQRTGGTAGMVKITAKSVAALGSTLLTAGESAETAGTATNAMFTKLALGEKGTKKYQSAMKELGLSSKAVQKSMMVDAQGSILNLLERVGKLKPEKQLGVLSDLFGNEHNDTIAKLAGNIAEYRKQILLATSAEAKGSMSREFEAQRATTLAQWQIGKNRIGELAVVIGSVLLPAVNDLLKSVGRVVTKMADWAREHPVLTKWVVGTTVAVAALTVTSWAAQYAFTFLRGGLLMLTGAYARVNAVMAMYRAGTLAVVLSTSRAGRAVLWMANLMAPLRAAIVSLIPAILSVGTAIMATPVGWIAAAVAAIVVGGIMIYKYWEPLKAFFIGFAEGFMAAVGPIGKAFSDAFGPVIDILGPIVMPILNQIGDWLSQALTWFSDLLTPIGAASQTTKDFGEAGRSCGQVVGDAFRVMLTPIMLVVDAIKWLHENITGVINKLGSVGTALGGKAFETVQTVKGWFGSDPAAVSVPPMRGSPAAGGAGAGKGGDTFNITQLPGENAEQLARRVSEIQRRQAGVSNRSGMADGALAR
jgi:TP901 family phage tail tape measure protein